MQVHAVVYFIFFAVIATNIHNSVSQTADIECGLEYPIASQMAFVVDGVVLRGHENQYERHQMEVIKKFMEFFEVADNPDWTEFALTAFWDWKDPAHPDKISDSNACYKLIVPFTTNQTEILSQAKTLENKVQNNNGSNWRTASSTVGALMTIMDKNLAWNEGFFDDVGDVKRKVVVIISSNEPTSYLKDVKHKRQAKLDGTDTCTNTLPPTKETLAKAVLDNDIILVAAIANIYGTPGDSYQELFKNSRMLYSISTYDVDPEQIATADFATDANNLAQSVKDEMHRCEWEAPPSYNTLGL